MQNRRLVKITLSAREDGVVSSEIACGDGATWEEVKKGIEMCQEELKSQLENSYKCPHAKRNNKTRF